MARTRTDVHSPKNLVTEDYDFFMCGYYGSQDEPGFSPMITEQGQALLADGWRFGGEGGGCCDHCGAHIKYFALLLHQPSHTIIRVGETCLDNRFERSSAEFHRLRKQAQLDRQAQRIKRLREAFTEANPEIVAHLIAKVEQYANGGRYDEFCYSLHWQLQRKGELSERQVTALQKSMAREAQWAAERAAQAASEPDPTPVIEGKIVVEGKILSVKWHENDFGGRLVMTVLDDRGFKLWGTVPRTIEDDLNRLAFDEKTQHLETGVSSYKQFVKDNEVRVRFNATVERSDRDESFGFFKRPTKGEVL